MSSRGHENNQRHILSSFREISRRKTGCYRPIHPSIHPSPIHPSIRQYKLALAWDPGGLGIRAAYGGKTKHQFRMIQVLRKPAILEKFSYKLILIFFHFFCFHLFLPPSPPQPLILHNFPSMCISVLFCPIRDFKFRSNW